MVHNAILFVYLYVVKEPTAALTQVKYPLLEFIPKKYQVTIQARYSITMHKHERRRGFETVLIIIVCEINPGCCT